MKIAKSSLRLFILLAILTTVPVLARGKISTRRGTIIARFTPVKTDLRQDIFGFRFHEFGLYIEGMHLVQYAITADSEAWHKDIKLPVLYGREHVVGVSWDVKAGRNLAVNDLSKSRLGAYDTVDLNVDFSPYFHVGYDQDAGKSYFYNNELGDIEILQKNSEYVNIETLKMLVNKYRIRPEEDAKELRRLKIEVYDLKEKLKDCLGDGDAPKPEPKKQKGWFKTLLGKLTGWK